MASPAQATPGDPPGAGGEPTIMAFRRPQDRPALGARPASAASGDLPVVLRLPDLARPAGAVSADSQPATARPWISTVLWTVTGVLALVAVGVLLLGKPSSEPAMDEAPSWQAPSVGDAAGPGQSNDGPQAVPFTQPGGTPTGAYPATQPPSNGQTSNSETWNGQTGNDRGAGGQSLESQPVTGYPSTATAGGAFPGGQPANAAVQFGTASGGTASGGTASGGFAPGGFAPGGGVQPVGNPNGPAAGGDFSSPEAPAPDQTKNLELHSYPLPASPGTQTGTARLDGGIGYPERRPGGDSTR